MFGLLSVLAFLGTFIWLGMSADDWDARSRRRLAVAVVALIVLLFIGISVFWSSRPYSYSPEMPAPR